MVEVQLRKLYNSCLVWNYNPSQTTNCSRSGEEEEEMIWLDMKYNPPPSVHVGNSVEVGLPTG